MSITTKSADASNNKIIITRKRSDLYESIIIEEYLLYLSRNSVELYDISAKEVISEYEHEGDIHHITYNSNTRIIYGYSHLRLYTYELTHDFKIKFLNKYDMKIYHLVPFEKGFIAAMDYNGRYTVVQSASVLDEKYTYEFDFKKVEWLQIDFLSKILIYDNKIVLVKPFHMYVFEDNLHNLKKTITNDYYIMNSFFINKNKVLIIKNDDWSLLVIDLLTGNKTAVSNKPLKTTYVKPVYYNDIFVYASRELSDSGNQFRILRFYKLNKLHKSETYNLEEIHKIVFDKDIEYFNINGQYLTYMYNGNWLDVGAPKKSMDMISLKDKTKDILSIR